MEREEEIRLIAYQIWEGEDRPHGRDLDHWLKAEAIWQRQHGREPPDGPSELPAKRIGDEKKPAGTQPRARRRR
jgi:hypothetical protein